jgi:ElaB/YqjD/DUF883 family membrane-anchored ribosome-binding protein
MSNVTRHGNRPNVGELGKEVRESARSAQDAVQSTAANLKEAAAEGFENLKSTASDYLEQGRDKAMEFEETLEEQIQLRPISSVLIAAGFGFLLGMLCTRR